MPNGSWKLGPQGLSIQRRDQNVTGRFVGNGATRFLNKSHAILQWAGSISPAQFEYCRGSTTLLEFVGVAVALVLDGIAASLPALCMEAPEDIEVKSNRPARTSRIFSIVMLGSCTKDTRYG